MKAFWLILLLASLTVAYADKVEWGSDGKAQIEKSVEEREGCQQGGIEDIGKDNNTSDC